MTSLLRWRCFGAATAVLALLACSGGDDAAPALAAEEQIRALADDAREAGYERQADRLADGEVTEAEYRQGMTDALTCMADQGLAVSEITRAETVFGWRFEAGFEPGSTTEPAEIEAIANACQGEHSIYLGQAWVYETGSTFTPQARPLIVECLEGLGYDAEDIVDDADAKEVTGDDHSPDYASCQTTVQSELNGFTRDGEPVEDGG